jgi:hypothetical protein
VELVPEFRGYDYFVLGDEIVIVDPSTPRVVEIIEAVDASVALLGATTRDPKPGPIGGEVVRLPLHPLLRQSARRDLTFCDRRRALFAGKRI